MFLASIVSQEPTLLRNVSPDDVSSCWPNFPLLLARFWATIGSDRLGLSEPIFEGSKQQVMTENDGRNRANVAVRWNHGTATFGIARQ